MPRTLNSKTLISSKWLGSLAGIALVLFWSIQGNCCPFCSAPSLTLSEQVGQSDAVVLVKWKGGEHGNLAEPGSTEFEIADVALQKDGMKLAKGGKIVLERYRVAKPGDEFLLFGTKIEEAIEWGSPLEVSKTAYEYIRSAPKPSAAGADRLKYFVQYLETEDKMIADDAFGEFANASYADVAKLAPVLPREKLRKWLTSKDISPGRTGLYGMMLGLCGNDDDAKLLSDKIMEQTDDFRLGIDGIMGGYLLLTREQGLAVLEKEKLANKKAPFSETYAAMQAVRFIWQYGDNCISPDRLRKSMRVLLDRPEVADLVIADLSRMKDWSVQDKLMEMFSEENNIPSVKRAIVRYMLSSTRDTGEKKSDSSKAGGAGAIPQANDASEVELPLHVIKGQMLLAELEKIDPKTVTEAKRFFLLK